VKALQLSNLPTPKEESWKYTNLPRAMPQGLTAAAPEEIVIHKKRGEVCGEPVDVLWTGLHGQIHTPVLNIEIEPNSELFIIERNEGQGAYWKNAATSIKIGDNARLIHIRIQEDSAESINTNMVEITLGRDAHYDSFTLNLGGKLTRHEIRAVLSGPGAEIHLNGLNLLKGKQHGDTTILVEHAAPNCQSNQFYRSILDDESRGVFQGKVHVHKIAQKTDGYQLSNTILLSPKAEMDTKPELEIYADDVKCSHGATTGQLDQEPLFYMQSRGIDEKSAKALLIQAFVAEVFDNIQDESLKISLERRVEAWLKQ